MRPLPCTWQSARNVRVLLLGAGGMLAHDLARNAPPDVSLTPLARAELDVTDHVALARTIRDLRPALVMNAAGYTRVDDAERERDLVFAVNGLAPGAIGRAAATVRAVVVHFSTDYVFDGEARTAYREEDRPHPVNVYGESKLAGERTLAASGVDHLIIRTQWLFGTGGRSFPRTMRDRAVQRLETRAVADQTGRPTYTADLARATWQLLGARARGTFHVANAGCASRYDVARRVFARERVEDLLTPCATGDVPTIARRPARGVLDTTRADILLGGPLPAWEESLDRFLEALGEQADPLSESHSPESRPAR